MNHASGIRTPCGDRREWSYASDGEAPWFVSFFFTFSAATTLSSVLPRTRSFIASISLPLIIHSLLSTHLLPTHSKHCWPVPTQIQSRRPPSPPDIRQLVTISHRIASRRSSADQAQCPVSPNPSRQLTPGLTAFASTLTALPTLSRRRRIHRSLHIPPFIRLLLLRTSWPASSAASYAFVSSVKIEITHYSRHPRPLPSLASPSTM